MASRGADAGTWTGRARRAISETLPAEHLLPDRQPAYVASWTYLFGAATIAGLVWTVATGVVLAAFGPQWWHTSDVGHFFNSMHFWAVQAFFVFMVLHLWAQFFGAGWRDGRAKTWVVGVVIFAFSVVTAFTGYLSQQNFASQWIAVNAKDAINSTGLGALFNVLNFGQMYGLHVMILPMLVLLLVAAHVVMVRIKGVVKPIDMEGKAA